MPKEPALVRASDIGQWAYCRRAWWLAVVQGAVHRRPERLQHGTRAHRQHGLRLARATRRQRLGWIVLGLGLLLLAAYLMAVVVWGLWV